jgi:hypothetical protein
MPLHPPLIRSSSAIGGITTQNYIMGDMAATQWLIFSFDAEIVGEAPSAILFIIKKDRASLKIKNLKRDHYQKEWETDTPFVFKLLSSLTFCATLEHSSWSKY